MKIKLDKFWLEEQVRLGRNVSISEVSAKTGLSRVTISNIKKGVAKNPELKSIDKICEFFGVEAGQPCPFLIVDYGDESG